MKKSLAALLGACALGFALSASAADQMGHDSMMKGMDANGDGMISKEEFMAYQEKKWDAMKKNSSGMVDAKSMGHDGMMKHDSMKSDSMKSDSKM
jgi:hypothetical protein